MDGKHGRLYEKLGSHVATLYGTEGSAFAVGAPNARRVSVIGDFNGWDPAVHPLSKRRDWSGIWEGFVPGVGDGMLYKYKVSPKEGGRWTEKADPFARFSETPPRTASIVWDGEHSWKDFQ